MLAIIGGTSLLYSDISAYSKRIIHTPYGSSELYFTDDVILLLRHQGRKPPHTINFCSHMAALAISGVDTIVAIGSAGSLHKSIPPGSLVIPDDYLTAAVIPSIYNHSICHIMPEMNQKLRKILSNLIPDARIKGRYIQAQGPRMETKSEIAAFSSYADIIGMTIASEATLASELKMSFAALCTIDNYANGITEDEMSYELIVEHAYENQKRTDELIHSIITAIS